MVFLADIHESADTSRRRGGIGNLPVYMDEDITVAFLQKACRLDAAHVVVCVDAGDILVFPLDSYDGDIVGGQLRGGDRGA